MMGSLCMGVAVTAPLDQWTRSILTGGGSGWMNWWTESNAWIRSFLTSAAALQPA